MMSENDKRRFSVTLTPIFVEALDRLVKKGLYLDNQDAIRDALRRLFRFHGFETFSKRRKKKEGS